MYLGGGSFAAETVIRTKHARKTVSRGCLWPVCDLLPDFAYVESNLQYSLSQPSHLGLCPVYDAIVGCSKSINQPIFVLK